MSLHLKYDSNPTNIADGSTGPARMTADGKIITAGGITDGDTFVPGETGLVSNGYLVDDVSTATTAEGTFGPARMTSDGKVIGAAYDSSSDANKSFEIAPPWAHISKPSFTLTNVPNATPDETIIIDLEGYQGCSFHVEKTGGSDTFAATFEASNEGTASTDDFIDVTTNGMTVATGGGLTADFIAHTNAALKCKALKLKITTAGAGNDADFNVFVYKF